MDITEEEETKKKIKKLNPKIVINAAAYTNVEKAEKEFVLAKKINSRAVKTLSEVCAEIDAVFVHYSTDYIFAGKNKNGYQEKDKTNKPINKYGLSKLLGEKEIFKTKTKCPNFKFYLIRTSWLFGSKSQPKKHKNFVQTILKLTKDKKEIKVIDDQFGKPTYTFDLAQATKKLLNDKKTFGLPLRQAGIYHLPNEGITSWYKFAKEIVRITGTNTKVLPCRTRDYRTLAKRPKYSILINTKVSKLRSWKLALRDYLKK